MGAARAVVRASPAGSPPTAPSSPCPYLYCTLATCSRQVFAGAQRDDDPNVNRAPCSIPARTHVACWSRMLHPRLHLFDSHGFASRLAFGRYTADGAPDPMACADGTVGDEWWWSVLSFQGVVAALRSSRLGLTSRTLSFCRNDEAAGSALSRCTHGLLALARRASRTQVYLH